MRTEIKKVEITPIKKVLTPREIKQLKKVFVPEPHNCHENAALACEEMENIGIECYFCDGYFECDGIVGHHAFNAVVKNGHTYYIDFTHEWANRKLTLNYILFMAQQYNLYEIEDIFDQEGLAFCPYSGTYNEEGDFFYYIKNKKHIVSMDKYFKREQLIKNKVRNLAEVINQTMVS